MMRDSTSKSAPRGFGIDGNAAVFEELIELLRSERAIAFVGAGASAGLYPLWGGLIEELAAEAVRLGTPESMTRLWCQYADDKPVEIAKQIRKALDDGAFAAAIRRIFGPPTDGSRRFTGAHEALVRLPFRGFVTTNYDACLDWALAAEKDGRLAQPFTWNEDRASLWLRDEGADDPKVVPILHAHGRYDEKDSIVLGIDEYRKVYGQATPYLDLLGELFTRRRLVFLGFGFNDPWLNHFADRVITQSGLREVAGYRHFAILGIDEAKKHEAEFHRGLLQESLRARVLYYPIREGSHAALGDLLDILVAELGEPDSVGAPTTRRPSDPLDAWFDHVIDANRRLADCFDRPGRLDLIEEAWVELGLRPDPEGGASAKSGRRVGKSVAPGDSGAELGHRLKLADALELGPRDAPWITGRWLLEGSPGSGKTTLLRHFARTVAAERDPARIPVLVSLARAVEEGTHLLTTVTAGFELARPEDVIGALEAAGREGRLIVLLDGLDEVPPEHRRAAEALLGFLRREWPECRLVLSTRPLGRGRVPAGFPRLELLPLPEERQRELLRKWLEASKEDAGEEAGGEDAGGEGQPGPEADRLLEILHADRGLQALAEVPLYLTLFAFLWQKKRSLPEKRAELYDEIFHLLLEGEHRREPTPIPARDDVREALRHLAYGMTIDDHAGETPGQLERRLREPALAEVVRRLRTEPPWQRSLRRFLDDVHEQTQILGPHNGYREPWCFWHRTFREALTAEYLHQNLGTADPADANWARLLEGPPEPEIPLSRKGGGFRGRGTRGEDAPETKGSVSFSADEANTRGDVSGVVIGSQAKDEGRWAEPLALLAGRLDEPDALVSELARVKPELALRSMVFTQGLRAQTLIDTLGLTEDTEERAKVFEQIPDQLGDPRACLELVERLKEEKPGGFDLFWLGWILDQVEIRWPGFAKQSRAAQSRLFDHIPDPDPDLFRYVDTPRDGRVQLWCRIPAGEGWIGSREDEEERYEDEGPRHRVTIPRTFRMAAVTVTNAQYTAFDPDRVDSPRPNDPVVEIDWWEAMAFCRWLSSLEGLGGARLPTEEEWEYACRAGTESRFWKGDAESELIEVGWYAANEGDRMHAVGEKKANPWGLYDVHGNVDEWTLSFWKSAYSMQGADIAAEPLALPTDLFNGSPSDDRAVRGGCYWDGAGHARSACRGWFTPSNRADDLGFRVLLPSAPGEPR